MLKLAKSVLLASVEGGREGGKKREGQGGGKRAGMAGGKNATD